MTKLMNALYRDEAGFIVSAELVLVGTICVVGMIVGLTEVAYGVNEELEDVGAAIGAVSQTYHFSGAKGCKAKFPGSCFTDTYDECDGQCDITCDGGAKPESSKGGH